jgi:hypothetical protein
LCVCELKLFTTYKIFCLHLAYDLSFAYNFLVTTFYSDSYRQSVANHISFLFGVCFFFVWNQKNVSKTILPAHISIIIIHNCLVGVCTLHISTLITKCFSISMWTIYNVVFFLHTMHCNFVNICRRTRFLVTFHHFTSDLCVCILWIISCFLCKYCILKVFIAHTNLLPVQYTQISLVKWKCESTTHVLCCYCSQLYAFQVCVCVCVKHVARTLYR